MGAKQDVSFGHARYVGGLPGEGRERMGNLWFTEDAVGLGTLRPKVAVVAAADVVSVGVGGGQVAKSKVGAELAFGVLGGLGARGAKDQASVALRLRSGAVAYFTVDRVAPVKVRAKIDAWVRARGLCFDDEVQAPVSAPAGASVGDELAKLADLRDRGVLSQREFEDQKTRLLG